MKLFSFIVALAILLGTMYGYVLGRLGLHSSRIAQSPASEYPTFLLAGNIWEQIIFWSAPPLVILFGWLTIKYVGQTYLREKRALLQEETILQVDELFKEMAVSGNGPSSPPKG